MQRGDRVRLPQPEVPQAVGLGLGALVVDLVGGQHDRLAGLAQDLDDRLVGVGDADGRVDHEQHRVGQGDRDLGLGADRLGQAAGVGVPAAGVDDGEGAAVPVGVVGDPVAGHAGDVLDDRLAAADDPVDQRGLADVGPTDDGEDRDGPVGSSARRASARSCAPWSVTPVAGSGSTSLGGQRTGQAPAGERLGLVQVDHHVLPEQQRRLLDLFPRPRPRRPGSMRERLAEHHVDGHALGRQRVVAGPGSRLPS